MQCPRCQHENSPRAKFCEECATPLARICSNCGTQFSPTAKFCPECARPVGAGAAQPGFASPEAYTPKHLAEKILTSKSAIEGERKQVTVLFADMKGSMELLADRDPEEARKILDPVLERMMEAVHRYEGTVNQVMGDGIMALFGAPLAHEDHAVRACYAALRMQEAVKRYAEDARRTHGVNVQIRVGLNSGEVVVRAIGSDLHMDYTAVGQTTHLAARMEQFASPGSILLTPTTLALVEGFVAVRSLGPVPVKGLAHSVEVFELTDVGRARTRLQAAAARGLTRFVGRDAEMAQLYDARSLAGQGHGQVVAVVGEPGVGKSRLFHEFTHSHRTQGWLVLENGSVSHGKATPYLPLSDLLRAYFRIETTDDVRAIRAKVTGNILTLDEALNEAIPPVLWLLDALPDDSPFLALEPAERRRRTLAAVKAMLLRESRVQPVLIVFEDLHWIDSETQAFLDSLAESLPAAPILLAVNYRPEYSYAWGSKTYYRQLRIDPLPPESAENLLTALLGTDASIAALTPLLIERTEGNPLFLEESVRTLVELGALAGNRGAFRLVKSLDAISVPATVQSILAARIDRLGAEDKRLLHAAAVVGKDVPFALLHAIAELDEDGLRRALGRLQAAEFLYEARLFPDLEYTFKHALTHEVAYASLLQEPRRTLHARITGAIEHLYSERLAEHVERLSYHAVRGAAWDKAVTYCGDAGDRVYERSAALAALGYYEQALDAIGHLPESRRTIERTIDLYVAIRTPLAQLVEYERVFNHLREAERLAVAIGDNTRLGRIFALLTFSKYQAGDPRGAIEYGQRALEIAAEGRDRSTENTARFFMAQAYLSLGEYGRALPLFEQAATTPTTAEEETLSGMHPRAREGTVRGWWAICLAEVGRFPEAVLRGQEAIEVANRVGEPFSRVAAHFCLGEVQLQQGDARKAMALLSRALDMCREFNVAMYHHRILGALGHAQVLLGDLVEGLTTFEAAVAWSRSKNIRFRLALLLASYGEALLMSGQRDEALAVAREAIEAARVHEDLPAEARALRVHGEVTSRGPAPDFTAAGASYRDAIRLAEPRGMRPLVAHCHLGLGKLYARTGKRQQAQEHLTTATALYREMEMRFWLEQAEAELRRP